MSEQTPDPKSPVRHSDFLRRVPSSPVQFEADSVRAIDVISGSNARPDNLFIELGVRVASLTLADRSQRISHHHRYRHVLDIPNEAGVVGADDESGFAEESLIGFHNLRSQKNDELVDSVLTEVGKGVSAELGHIDQYGDWVSARPLDDEIRQLPASERLKQAGFVFSETYGQKDVAKIDYSFKLVNNEQGRKAEDRGKPSASIMGIRKRAAADIRTSDGSRYEIIKRSSFLVDVLRLPDDQQPLLADIFGSLRKIGDFSPGEQEIAERRAHEAGKAIIEPYLSDRTLRERSKVVLAVSTLYFALKRY